MGRQGNSETRPPRDSCPRSELVRESFGGAICERLWLPYRRGQHRYRCWVPALADSLDSVVRTINAIINSDDAWKPEDQARRHDRPSEKRYWRNYGAG